MLALYEKHNTTIGYEWNNVVFGYNVVKQKKELTKILRKKLNFINRLKQKTWTA